MMSGAAPEERVRVPMLRQSWRDVAFVHWRYEEETVQRLLPSGLHVDQFDGTAWVTLVSFAVRGTRPPLLPALPFVSNFTETNLRTYVVGPDGRDGLWFFTLETDSLPTVIAARAIGIPYRWAQMTAGRSGRELTYGSRRRSAGVGAMHLTRVAENGHDASDPRADWLTGRWRAWTCVGPRLAVVPVEHQPWPLRTGVLLAHEDSLLSDSTLPIPAEPPLVHAARRVDAALGWPQPLHAAWIGGTRVVETR
jgi:uncharacterized protein YqjF (DUF2071 family)